MTVQLGTPAGLRAALDRADVGPQMHALIADLYPICRSITGNGLRETLRRIGNHIPLTLHEVPSGTPVLDWTIPREWNIRDGFIATLGGERVVDFQRSNLHVVNYSAPVTGVIPLNELRERLFTIPDRPEWIPYRTSYYKEDWGFCLTQNQLLALNDPAYEVRIDSSLEEGSLTYAECFLPGRSEEEVLVSCHSCHPSLCNDNLSGIAVATYLARHLRSFGLRYSYRFLFLPATIGAIAWLALNEAATRRIKHGVVLAWVGDRGPSTYKRSRRGNAEIDRAFAHVLHHAADGSTVVDFSPTGADERQYGSPGFNLPVGCLMRTPPERFPQYHTSADDLTAVTPESLADSLAKCVAVFEVLEHNDTYVNRFPKGEPKLGDRGLFRPAGGWVRARADERALLWVLNLSDGEHTLLDIAERSGLPFTDVQAAADVLAEHALIERVGGAEAPL